MKKEKSKQTILIADDSEQLLDLLQGEFEKAGWEVVVASDGAEVFRKFTAYNPMAVLLDVYMPEIDGINVCRLIKGHVQWKTTYLVIMSSRIGEKDIETYKKIGADAILPKPFTPKQALELFETALLDRCNQ